MKRLTYDESIAFIHGAYETGEKNGLENMRALLEKLGNPEKEFRSVHVAGTNGKGSTCAFLQAILRCAGYKTGLYTSPFLQRYNERMRIDGAPIPNETLALLTSEIAEAEEDLRGQGIHPTVFELGTALAFLYFARKRVDIAVVEVGLGGRLDPTNVLQPEVSVITAIGMDHTQILGDTLEIIAEEKAGIIKENVPVVVSSQNQTDVRSVIERKCKERYNCYYLSKPTVGFPLGLSGEFQAYNAGTALAAAQILRDRAGYNITDMAIQEGLRRARWPGRLEWLPATPPVLLDGAHNMQATQALAAYLRGLPTRKTALVCAIMRDKEWHAMAKTLSPSVDVVLATMPANARSVPPGELARAFSPQAISCDTVPEALEKAVALAGPEGRVVIAGSLYLVGEARSLLANSDSLLLSSK